MKNGEQKCFLNENEQSQIFIILKPKSKRLLGGLQSQLNLQLLWLSVSWFDFDSWASVPSQKRFRNVFCFTLISQSWNRRNVCSCCFFLEMNYETTDCWVLQRTWEQVIHCHCRHCNLHLLRQIYLMLQRLNESRVLLDDWVSISRRRPEEPWGRDPVWRHVSVNPPTRLPSVVPTIEEGDD